MVGLYITYKYEYNIYISIYIVTLLKGLCDYSFFFFLGGGGWVSKKGVVKINDKERVIMMKQWSILYFDVIFGGSVQRWFFSFL